MSEGEAACCFTWKAVVSPVTPTPTLTLTPALTLEPQPLSRNPSSSRRPNPNPNPWKVVVNGQDGPQGLSFYEVHPTAPSASPHALPTLPHPPTCYFPIRPPSILPLPPATPATSAPGGRGRPRVLHQGHPRAIAAGLQAARRSCGASPTRSFPPLPRHPHPAAPAAHPATPCAPPCNPM